MTVTDLLHHRHVLAPAVAEVPYDVFHHHHRAVDDHAEVQRAEGEQVGRDIAQVQADRGKQQRERDGQRHDQRAAQIAQENEQDNNDQDDAFGQVVQHRMGRERKQVATIEERHNGDARR